MDTSNYHENQQKGRFHTLCNKVQRTNQKRFNFTRMSESTFGQFLPILEEKLTKEDTRMSKLITPEEILVINALVNTRIKKTGNKKIWQKCFNIKTKEPYVYRQKRGYNCTKKKNYKFFDQFDNNLY